jgi:hypothetical protein
MAKSYVDKILDAASMASRQDTLGDMLNQLPGLLVEQERYRDQQQREDDRYAEELTFRNKQYQDIVDARNLASDIELINIGADLEGESGLAYFDNVSFSTEKGRNLGSALRNSKNISVTSNNTINENIRTFSTGLAQMDYEDARKGLDAINLDLESKGIKRDLSSLEKQVAVKQGREFANDVLSVVDFENEDELRNIISGSNNPAQIVEFMVNRLDKDKLDSIENKKDKEELFIKYGNMYSTLLNSGAPESQLSNISNRMTTLQLDIDGDKVEDVKLGEPGSVTETGGFLEREELEAFKSQGKSSGTIVVENNDESRTEKNIEINLDTGEYRYFDASFDKETKNRKIKELRDKRKEAKTREEYDSLTRELKEIIDRPIEQTVAQRAQKEEVLSRIGMSGAF